MPIAVLLLALQPAAAAPPPAPPCRAAQLRLSTNAGDGAFDGMSHAGTQLSIRNTGPNCTLPALPVLRLLDARGRVLAAVRRVPPGMHPGPVMLPLRLGGGHRATAALRWVSGPVFPANRSVRAARVSMTIDGAVLSAPLRAVLYGAAGAPVSFDQPPLRVVEGMAAG